MDEPKFVNGLDSKHALGNIESCDIFRERVVLDKHGHEISTRQELHDEVEVCRVLKRVEQLNDPWRVRFRKDVSFRANVRELSYKMIEMSRHVSS